MSVRDQEDLVGLRRAGRAVADAIGSMAAALTPGVTTSLLDRIAAAVLERHGARPAPALTYGFPGTACISVNEEVCHGIPGDRRLVQGDVVNLDVSAELDGYFADAGASYPVGEPDPVVRRLCLAGRRALQAALRTARAGVRIGAVGGAIEAEALRDGFRVIRDLGGHGVGRALHEPPGDVLNHDRPWDPRRLTPGLVLTLEPMLSVSADHVRRQADGWTLSTEDGSLAVQYEHTVVITAGAPVVVTAPD